MPFLSDDFLAPYKTKTPPWGPLGWVTYKRTYARWLSNEGRTEQWWETIRRVVEGNLSIVPNDPTATKDEAEALYDAFFNMYVLPPGRGLWMMGTDVAKRSGESLFNCWACNVVPQAYLEGGPVKPSTSFVFMADMSMLGGGVGFNISKESVAKFEPVSKKVSIYITCDPKHANVRELDAETIPTDKSSFVYVRVADTRRGWTDAIRYTIDAAWKQDDYDPVIVFDVSDVRKAGARIKGFGGTAAGPGPLVKCLRSLNEILNARVGQNLRPIDALDMMNVIGKCVVSGNVRRSAQIAVGDIDDRDFREAKLDEEALMDRRWASNNSVLISDDSDLSEVVKTLAQNGEPGLVNLERGRNYGRYVDGFNPEADPHVSGVNPCSEIFLENMEPCNLVELFPSRILESGGNASEFAALALRYAKRVTFSKMSWDQSAKVIARNRRVGVSISGWDDFKLMYSGDSNAYLDALYLSVRAADAAFSDQLGCSMSIKTTTNKPSGSISNLPGVSHGRHRRYSKWYVRRIRMASTDPLVEVLTDAGFPIESDLYVPNTEVVSFPVESPTAHLPGFVSAGEDTIEAQFEDQWDLQTWWADNSVSSTITFHPHEVDKIEGLLKQYPFKSTSLLPYSGHGYEQAPFEPISEERYRELMGQIRFWPSEEHMDKERRDMELLSDDECAGGACPIR